MADNLPDDLEDETPEQVRARIAIEGGLPGDLEGDGAYTVDETSIASTPYGPRENPLRRPGVGESIVQGAANALGTGDTIGAMLQAALQEGYDLPAFLRGDMTLAEHERRKWQTFKDARAENLRLTRAAMEDHPAATIAGRLVPGAMAAPAMGAGAAFGSSVAMGAGTGAIEGGAQSEAETPGQFASDVGKGFGLGALGGGLGYLGGKYVLAPAGAFIGRQAGRLLSRNADTLQEGAEQFARERALKAAGYIQKDFPDTREGMDALLQRGQRYLDEPGFIRYGSSAAAINDRAEALKRAAGSRIGQYLDQADEAASNAFGAAPYNPLAYSAAVDRARAAGRWSGAAFNPEQLAAQARAEGGVIDEALNNPNLRQQGAVMNEWMNDVLDTERRLAARGEPFSFRRANEYKGGLQDTVYNNKGLPRPNKEVADDFQRLVINEIDNQAEPFIGEAGVAGFRNARQRYGDFSDAAKRSAQQVNREVGNNFMGLKDMQAGQMAQQTQALPYIGPAIAVASKFARGRMDSTAARAADAFAKSGTLQTLANTSPDVIGGYGAAIGGVAGGVLGDLLTQPGEDWMDRVAREDPEALGKWGQYLGAAAAESPEALSMAKYDLGQTDPDYQQQRRKQGDSQR